MSTSTLPLLIVLSGPSGVGKDAALTRMRELGKPYHFTITATTREKRSSETDGVDYIFVSQPEFRRMIEAGELLEWAEVHDNLYGVPRSQVADALSRGLDVILKIDVQGAATIRRIVPDAVFIFLAAPSIEELARRLRRRMTESPEAFERRLQTAENEMAEASKFDHLVYNHRSKLDAAVREIESLISRERLKQPCRNITL